MDDTCGKCGGPAKDGPIFETYGLLCWFCADAHFDAARLPWGDPAEDLDISRDRDVLNS